MSWVSAMPAESLQIREVASGEVSLMRDLNAVFAAAFEDRENYAARLPGDDYLSRWLEDSSHIPLVAIHQNQVVAGLVAYELQKFEQERSEIYIYDLGVLAEHRRKGLATALIRELQRIAAERGAWVIYVQADQGDEPAMALYQSLGTREEVLHYDIPVELSPRNST